jgi:hypothetical protein
MNLENSNNIHVNKPNAPEQSNLNNPEPEPKRNQQNGIIFFKQNLVVFMKPVKRNNKYI